jgi:hypothetical protein
MFQYIRNLSQWWMYHAYVFLVCTFFPPVSNPPKPHVLCDAPTIVCHRHVCESFPPEKEDVYYTWTSPSSDMAIGQIPETFSLEIDDSHFSNLQRIVNRPIYVEYNAPHSDTIRLHPPDYLWTVHTALFSKAHIHSLLNHGNQVDKWDPLYTVSIMDHDYNVIHISSHQYITFSETNQLTIHTRQ